MILAIRKVEMIKGKKPASQYMDGIWAYYVHRDKSMHCQCISCTSLLDMGLASTEGKKKECFK